MPSSTPTAPAAARTRRLVTAITALIVTSLAVAVGAARTVPAHADTSSSTTLTCRDFNGAGFINWDVLVQLNPDGTARSAEQTGDAYLTGLQVVSVVRTGPATIDITGGGRSLRFHGDAVLQSGVPETSVGFSADQGCTAEFTFPNPQSPYTNLTPTS